MSVSVTFISPGGGTMLVRLACPNDDEAIWRLMEPIIRARETYPLPSDMSKADALAYWNAPDAEPSWSKMKKKS